MSTTTTEKNMKFNTLSDTEVIRRLQQQLVFIMNGLNRGESRIGSATLQRVDKYNDLSEEAKSRSQLWEAYCEATGSAMDHNGHDLLA
jgi:hypothetical protein